MARGVCEQCGERLGDLAVACPRCGRRASPSTLLLAGGIASLDPARTQVHGGGAVDSKSGLSSGRGAVAPESQKASFDPKRTQLVSGPSSGLAPAAAPARAPGDETLVVHSQRHALASPKAAARVPSKHQTLVGVPVPSSGAPSSRHAAQPVASHKQTMIGVAVPGIAPPPRPPPGPPTSSASSKEPSTGGLGDPAKPRRRDNKKNASTWDARRSIPLALAAAVAGACTVIGALSILRMTRPSSLEIHAKLDADGNDVVAIRCESCKDGARVEWNGKAVAFQGGVAEFPLSVPLRVGDNPVALRIERPRWQRDERVQTVVRVTHRLRVDLASLEDEKPSIGVRVEAVPDARVTIDGVEVPLSASGTTLFRAPVMAETSGPSDESKVIDRLFSYVVVVPGEPPSQGELRARTSVAPLRIDAPFEGTVVDASQFTVAGRAAKGASVTLNGRSVSVAADGSFETTISSTKPGAVPVTVRTSLERFAPRIATVSVRRADDLEAEAKAFPAREPMSVDDVSRNPDAFTGKPAWLEGDVVEVKAVGPRTLIQLLVAKGCEKGPCSVRVISPRIGTISTQDRLKVYGRLARVVHPTGGGRPIPELEALFLIKVPKWY